MVYWTAKNVPAESALQRTLRLTQVVLPSTGSCLRYQLHRDRSAVAYQAML